MSASVVEIQYQRDEYNGNVWDWMDAGDLFEGIRVMFVRHPLLKELTLTYETVDMRFRRKPDEAPV